MSYNITKISTKEPSSDGNIALNVADVISVSSLSDAQTLIHNGTNWENKNALWVNESKRGSNTISYTGTDTYSLMPLLYPAGYPWPTGYRRTMWWWRRVNNYWWANHVNNSENDTDVLWYQSSGTTQMYYAVELKNAGVYRLYIKYALSNSYGEDDQSCTVQWSNNDNTIVYGPRFRVHRASMKSPPCIGIINATGGEKVILYRHSIQNNPQNPLGSTMQDFLLIIEKLS